MSTQLELRDKIVEVDANTGTDDGAPVLIILTPEEFEASDVMDEEARNNMRSLTSAESTYVETYPHYSMGSFAVPDKNDPSGEPSLFSFYIDRQHLMFVEDGTLVNTVTSAITQGGTLRSLTTAHALYAFFRTLLVNDLGYLGRLEDQMEDLEEAMIETDIDTTTEKVMDYRRSSARLRSYYQQTSAMATVLVDNENQIMSHADAQSFQRVVTLSDRLIDRAETIKEYSNQLHELHQTHIDMRQNRIMQVFTIVTVLFAPLTLITGWFGMNLTVLPGLDWEPLWMCIIIFAIVSTGGLLAFYRWKKWL